MPLATKLAAVCAALLLPVAASAIRQGPVQRPLSSQIEVEVRRATAADAEIFANITIAAFQESAIWKYLHQFQDQYPHDTYDCFVGMLRDGLSWPAIMAHLGFVASDDPPHDKIAVSAALWNLPKSLRKDASPSDMAPGVSLLGGYGLLADKCRNRDFNVTRALDYSDKFDKYVDGPLGRLYPPRQQLLLQSIGTLPAYQGHDIAGHLLRKGLTTPDDIPDDKLPKALYATLAATTDGEPLYAENGYESFKNVTIHFLDGLGSERYDIMAKQLRP